MSFVPSTDTTGANIITFGSGGYFDTSRTTYAVSVTSPVVDTTVSMSVGEKGISPTLFFKFIKNKAKGSKIKMDRVQKRMEKLEKLVVQFGELEQRAAYEEYSKMLVVAIYEQQMAGLGFDTYVLEKDIEKFIRLVKDRVVLFKDLEKFPRPIPKVVRDKIKQVAKDKNFDGLKVLYVDYTKQELKKNSEKIRDKDPILFGYHKIMPEKLWYITEWVDDHCDLSLDEVVDVLKEAGEYKLSEVERPSKEYVENIKKEVLDRVKDLENTSRDTWREKEVASIKKELEEKLRKEAEEKANAETKERLKREAALDRLEEIVDKRKNKAAKNNNLRKGFFKTIFGWRKK